MLLGASKSSGKSLAEAALELDDAGAEGVMVDAGGLLEWDAIKGCKYEWELVVRSQGGGDAGGWQLVNFILIAAQLLTDCTPRSSRVVREPSFCTKTWVGGRVLNATSDHSNDHETTMRSSVSCELAWANTTGNGQKSRNLIGP